METLKLRVSAQKFKAFSRINRKAVVLGFDDVVEKGVSLKNARLMGDALVASKQEGAQGFHKVWVSDAPIKAEYRRIESALFGIFRFGIICVSKKGEKK